MSEYWKTQDLEGNGLQTINQQFSRLKRNTKTAYLLSTLFPLGAHQFYLKTPSAAYIFISLTAITIITAFYSITIAAIFFLAELILLIRDIINMDSRVVQFNKQLKMNLSLQSNTAPPPNYRGRYTKETPIEDYMKIKDTEITAFEKKTGSTENTRVYSFAEQEALLKEMSKNKKQTHTK